MELFRLNKNIEFNDGDHGHAQVLYADSTHRALRFSLRKGQKIENFHPHSPVQVFVLQGTGIFEGKNGYQTATSDTLILFEQDEKFSVRSENEDLVFVAVMHGSSKVDPDHAPIRG